MKIDNNEVMLIALMGGGGELSEDSILAEYPKSYNAESY